MKKLISILTIAAIAGVIAVGCSTPEESGKTGETSGAPATAGAGGTENKAPDSTTTDSTKMEDKGAAPATGGAPAATGGAPAATGGAPAATGGDAGKMDEKKDDAAGGEKK